jgi:hypothetical protein
MCLIVSLAAALVEELLFAQDKAMQPGSHHIKLPSCKEQNHASGVCCSRLNACVT